MPARIHRVACVLRTTYMYAAAVRARRVTVSYIHGPVGGWLLYIIVYGTCVRGSFSWTTADMGLLSCVQGLMCKTRNGPRPRHPGSRTRFDLHVAGTNVIVIIIITIVIVVVVISGPFAHSPGYV